MIYPNDAHHSVAAAALERVAFASCYVYSPSGPGVASERSRLLRALLKSGDAKFIFRFAARVQQEVIEPSILATFLRPTQVLIPVPGSAPAVAGTPSVAEHVAAALAAVGLGQDIWAGLRRIRRVGKSSTAPPGSRPSVFTHYDSFAVEPHHPLPPQVLLIDDVVTKGRTLLAAAARLRQAYPHVEVRAFALLRTLGFAQGLGQLLDPCIGAIHWRGGDARRVP